MQMRENQHTHQEIVEELGVTDVLEPILSDGPIGPVPGYGEED